MCDGNDDDIMMECVKCARAPLSDTTHKMNEIDKTIRNSIYPLVQLLYAKSLLLSMLRV